MDSTHHYYKSDINNVAYQNSKYINLESNPEIQSINIMPSKTINIEPFEYNQDIQTINTEINKFTQEIELTNQTTSVSTKQIEHTKENTSISNQTTSISNEQIEPTNENTFVSTKQIEPTNENTSVSTKQIEFNNQNRSISNIPLSPFFDAIILISPLIWLPIECIQVPSEDFPNSLKKHTQNSWFSVHIQKSLSSTPLIQYPLTPISSPEIPSMPKPSWRSYEDKNPAGKSIKIRLYPTFLQRVIINNWFLAADWTYNQALQQIEELHIEKNISILSKMFVKSTAKIFQQEDNKWILDIPHGIRDGTIMDLLTAYKSSNSNYKNGNIQHYKMRYRNQSLFISSIFIRSDNIKIIDNFHLKIYPRSFPKPVFDSIETKQNLELISKAIKDSTRFPWELNYACRLQKTRSGKYYLCVPLPLNIQTDIPKPLPTTPSIISLDPGVRTFMTCYDPINQLIIEWGPGDINKIYDLCLEIDDLQSEMAQLRHHGTSNKILRMRKVKDRMHTKIKNMIQDFHCRLVKWLVENYNQIILPDFNVANMVYNIDGKRKIRSKTALQMLTWSHCEFRDRLIEKTREYPACKIYLVEEAYTTKTCTRCGRINDPGGSKIYKCGYCNLTIDRDINGARNIFIKNVKKSNE